MKKITPAQLGLPTTTEMPKRRDWSVGMIGFGGIAAAHARDFADMGLPVAAFADPDTASAERAAPFGITKRYEDFRDLIADDEVNVLDLNTHPTIREAVILAACEAGKHIITEKPLTRDPDEGARMVEAAKKAGITFAVHQNYRWMHMNLMAHHIVKKGLIGDPYFASIEIFGNQDVGLRDHHFYAVCDDFLTIQWDNHLADLLRYWTGRDAVRVMARTTRMKGQNFVSDNLLSVVTDFGDGLTGQVMHSELTRSGMTGLQCRIEGDRGSIRFDFHENLEFESTELGKDRYTLDISDCSLAGSWSGSMANVLTAIEQDREPMVSAHDNMTTMRTILAEHASTLRNGEWVQV
jgi:predicted dehydrogenase